MEYIDSLEITKVHKQQRIELVFSMLTGGATRSQIIAECEKKQFGVSEGTIDRYIREAKNMLVEYSAESIEEIRAWHIAQRKQMMVKNRDDPHMLLDIAKDLARIQGLYVDIIHLTTGNESEEIEQAKKLLEGTDYKVEEPEGDSEYGS